ncbi:uncharacterized protein MYCFIDRAFT_200067 [Pseudocercospora fijiensis CIRAD86]|uniref:Uncharacterized protein n=1 Tax=Pseudocercospora fijiensis (strain CIRAD86) TaxID=383855 RepID=M3AJB7_PSEFD|nr:uncharacterized protein MYCFIDRAFT_200067 [Pseudocercospora fijiensis CIRAD86]EME77577.1 hypothetical protein MYCFIDRAFT_200067 [Pseudocercospora fijiensis CIRAD86]
MDHNTKPEGKLPRAEKQTATSTTLKSRIPIRQNTTHSRPRYCPVRKRNTRRWGIATLSEKDMKLLSTTPARLSHDLTTLEALEGRANPRSSLESAYSNNSSGSIPIILDLHHMLDTAIRETTSNASELPKRPSRKPRNTKLNRRAALKTIDEEERASTHNPLSKTMDMAPIPKPLPSRKRTTLLTLKQMLTTPPTSTTTPQSSTTSPSHLLLSGTLDPDLTTLHTSILTSARLANLSAQVARKHMLKAEKAVGKVDIEKGFFSVVNLRTEWSLVEEGRVRGELGRVVGELERERQERGRGARV